MRSRTVRILVVPLFALAFAGTTLTLMAANEPRPAGAASSANPPAVAEEDRQAIERLAQGYAFAWSTHDVDGLMRLYTPDANILSAREGGARGAGAIRPLLERQIGDPARDTRATIDVQGIEPLGPGLALVDVVRRASRVTSNEPVPPPAPGAPNPPPGVPRGPGNRPVDTDVTRGTWIVAKAGDEWRIRSERSYPDPHTCAMQGTGGAGAAGRPSPATEPLDPRWNAPLPPPGDTPSRIWPQVPTSPEDPSRSPWQTPGGF
ncbi:MAG: SgcJ/EcaC family oxidoreductase [Myxococcaceae bacterium]|nr:SgcJ/EcaC family oxidoreductase [Myxococcaceae bacterium]